MIASCNTTLCFQITFLNRDRNRDYRFLTPEELLDTTGPPLRIRVICGHTRMSHDPTMFGAVQVLDNRDTSLYMPTTAWHATTAVNLEHIWDSEGILPGVIHGGSENCYWYGSITWPGHTKAPQMPFKPASEIDKVCKVPMSFVRSAFTVAKCIFIISHPKSHFCNLLIRTGANETLPKYDEVWW